MERRIGMKMILLAGAFAVAGLAQQPAKPPIQLHCDLSVVPNKEKEVLRNFETVFRPAASKMPGYIDVRLLKLRSAVYGKAPVGVTFRFNLTFQSEELRQKWIASDVHQKVWPTIENLLTSKEYSCVLFDSF
jgi:heme-degrading monooxygenase HmoA